MIDDVLAASNSKPCYKDSRLLNGDVSSASPNTTHNSTEHYPESCHSSSYEGEGASAGSNNSHYDAAVPGYIYPKTVAQDELIGDHKKKKNKKIKQAMKHLKRVYLRSSSKEPSTSRCEVEPVTSEYSSSGVSFMSSIAYFPSHSHYTATHSSHSQMLPNTNPKSRENDFHKLFKSLPEGETLIQDFSCALLRDILVQGRMYVSQNWFCFYANILGWETLLTIEVNKITAIKKEKTALVINNAISVSTREEKYFFSSFMSRDSAHNHMSKIWRSNSSDARTPADSIETNADENSDSYVSDEDDESSDIQQDAPFLHPALVPSDHGPRTTETISFNEEDETCVCVSHYDNEHLNQEFNLNIEKLYKLLFNDDSTVQSKMIALQKEEDNEVSSWQDSLEGASERTLTYKIPLNANLGPKTAEVIEKQVLASSSVATKCYIINCEVTNPNVPYGDKFNIVKRYCLTRSSEHSCKLRLTSDVQYRKGVWGMVKSIIEKNSKEGINEYCEDLCMCLQEESAGPGIKIRKSASFAGAHTSASLRRQSRTRAQTSVTEQSRGGAAISFITDNYLAFILLMMAVLLILNLVLVHRLSSMTSGCNNQIDVLSSLPHSEEGKSEWIRILTQQQELHKKEIDRWQDVLRWISKLVSEVHGSLEKLQKSSIYPNNKPQDSWETTSFDKTEL